MNGEDLIKIVDSIIYLLPLLLLVWRLSRYASKLEQLEKEVDEKTTKFCADHKTIEAKIEADKEITNKIITDIMSALTEMKTTIARIDTKLGFLEKQGEKKTK